MVVPMDVGRIVLGRPWIYDLNVTNYGRAKICVFDFEGKKVKLNPLPPKGRERKKASVNESGEKDQGVQDKDLKMKGIHILDAKEFKKEVHDRGWE